MGKKENPLVQYYSKNQNFAGLLNGWLFRGKEYIQGQELSDGDRRLQQGSGKSRKRYRERYRDIYKHLDKVSVRLLIGTELQEHVDYTMPLRVMDYDTGSVLRRETLGWGKEFA